MTEKESQLKISELIELLKKALREKGDLLVELEGCDCVGDAVGVASDYTEHAILIRRYEAADSSSVYEGPTSQELPHADWM